MSEQSWWDWFTTPWNDMPRSSLSVPGTITEALTGNDDSTLSQSKYKFDYRVFPNDLGMDYLGHYMVININVPVMPFTGTPRGSRTTTSQFSDDLLENEFSKVDVLRFGNVNSGDAVRADSFPRRTRRITQSIALFMPGSQLIYSGKNAYEEASLTALGGQLLTGILAQGGAGYYLWKNPTNLGNFEDVVSGTGRVLNGLGETISTGAQLAGAPINPRVEVLFATTPLRDFQFEFLMIPRNEQEAKSIKDIVRTLRFYAAPELSLAGFTYVPPAEFDITFFHRGVENLNIPRINTCVLLECEVDYAPNLGIWQTYRDGNPFATRLRLVFKEIEAIHKLRVLQGF